MVKNFSTKLSGQIGENLVVAELGRRGIIATSFAGNVPEIDILAYKDKRSIPIQVKALKVGSLRTRADYYLNKRMEELKCSFSSQEIRRTTSTTRTTVLYL